MNADPILQRGIEPELLLSQIKNTMPYLFFEPTQVGFLGESLLKFPPVAFVQSLLLHIQEKGAPLDHLSYFKLCLSAHYLTCATPVPTDVDNQIRQKLWLKPLPFEIAQQMARFVLESRGWNFTSVSSRFTSLDKLNSVQTPFQRAALSGHLGEWFTVAAGAYCALFQYVNQSHSREGALLQDEIFAAIEDEVVHHAEHFSSLWRNKSGIDCLKAAANIAHNLGDLDRVMDQWSLPPLDRLRVQFYKLGVSPFDVNRQLRHKGVLWVAGELYKSPILTGSQKASDASSMALENHRHFALRKPRVLRQSPDFLVPNGPFFDDFGLTLGKAFLKQSALDQGQPALDSVMEALLLGWKKLPKTVGYARAIRGLLESGVLNNDAQLDLTKSQRQIVQLSKDRFEKQWSEQALKWMDEIPGRA